MLLGSAAAMGTAGCTQITFPPAPKTDDVRFFEKEAWISGDQTNCAPLDETTPTDLAWPLRMMKVRQAWKYSQTHGQSAYGKGIRIGHVDTGIADHLELRPLNEQDEGPVLRAEGYDFVDDVPGGYDPLVNTIHLEQIGHGTATASVIASRGDYDENWDKTSTECGGTTGPGRITGTAPASLLIPVRAFRLSAPGFKVWRAYRDEKSNRLDLVSPRFGTSFAVSLTAGVAALWLAHHGPRHLSVIAMKKNLTLQDLFRRALTSTAEPWTTEVAYRKSQFGAGIVDAYALLQADPEKLA